MRNLITIWQVTKCDSREPFNPLVVLKSSEEDAKKLLLLIRKKWIMKIGLRRLLIEKKILLR